MGTKCSTYRSWLGTDVEAFGMLQHDSVKPFSANPERLISEANGIQRDALEVHI